MSEEDSQSEEIDASKVAADIREYVHEQLLSGFITPNDVLQALPEYFEGSFPAHYITEFAENIVNEEKLSLQEEMKSWEQFTDCDKLDKAFQELERKGIVARHNWTCCSTCGHYEISGEMEQLQKQGQKVIGYCFYHQQDTEAAVRGGGVFIAFGGSSVPPEEVGKEIKEVLEENGLEVTWNGSAQRKISVHLDWKRRRVPPNYTKQ